MHYSLSVLYLTGMRGSVEDSDYLGATSMKSLRSESTRDLTHDLPLALGFLVIRLTVTITEG